MKKIFALLTVLVVLGLASPSMAKSIDDTIYPQGETAVIVLAQADTGEETEKTTGEILTEGKDAAAKVKDAVAGTKEGASGKEARILWALALAAVLKFLIDALKKWVPWFKDAKKAPVVICLVIGAAVGFLDMLALGGTWMSALIMFGSGPGAVAVNEVFKLAKSSK